MPHLYWPRRGKFVDHDRNDEYHGEGVYEVPEDAVDQYLARGWEHTDDDHDETDDDAEMAAADTDAADEADSDDEAAEADDETDDEYICGAPTSNDEPCQNPVDGPDERCHTHAE